MKKIGIVITDGVGYRNFILSNFIAEAVTQFDQIVIYSGLPSSVFGALPPNVIIRELEMYNEGYMTWFFRKWKEVAHMQRGREYYGMQDNKRMNYPANNSPTGLLIKLTYFLTYFHSSQKSILFAEKLQFLMFSRNRITLSYIAQLESDKPTHVFFTHQRPPYLAPFLYAVKKLMIPVSSFIFSWDNLASKGRMLGMFNYFLVWSDLMKQELLTFYSNVLPENVFVVGTPQFEPYVMPIYERSPGAFYSRFGLDQNKKTICFSCADATIGRNDPLIIEAIATLMRNGGISADCQLLVRTSPAEDGERFQPVVEAFPEIIWNNPKWILTRANHAEAWSQRIPDESDIMDLRSILENADLNINMCSTMSLDFMMFDKPVINTTFGNLENGLYNDQKFLKYVHYKKVIDSGAVVIAKDVQQLQEAINTELAKPFSRSEQRKQLINLQISKPLLHTSKRIAETLSSL